VGRDESCTWVGSGCLLLFAVSVLDGAVSPRYLVPGAESAFAAPRLSNTALRAYAPTPV